MTSHQVHNPQTLAPAIGFAHVVAAAPGRTVYLGGQTAHGPDNVVHGETVVDQFDRAAANVVTALVAAGARPEHLVSVQIYTTDVPAYRAALPEIGATWRRHFGRHYPASALFGVTELFDPDAMVELVCVAVVPD